MSIGNILYLLMTIGSFVAFSAVLGNQSRLQTKLGPEMLPAKVEHEEPQRALAA